MLYKPTTEEIRNGYACDENGKPDWILEEQFDAWLAEVKAKAVAEWQAERLAAFKPASPEVYEQGETE